MLNPKLLSLYLGACACMAVAGPSISYAKHPVILKPVSDQIIELDLTFTQYGTWTSDGHVVVDFPNRGPLNQYFTQSELPVASAKLSVSLSDGGVISLADLCARKAALTKDFFSGLVVGQRHFVKYDDWNHTTSTIDAVPTEQFPSKTYLVIDGILSRNRTSGKVQGGAVVITILDSSGSVLKPWVSAAPFFSPRDLGPPVQSCVNELSKRLPIGKLSISAQILGKKRILESALGTVTIVP